MIASFGDRDTEALFHGGVDARRLPATIRAAALRKLDMLNAAGRVDDLRVPPGNRLEALKGSRRGWYSIRVNQRWRIVFRWEANDAPGVQIVDYH